MSDGVYFDPMIGWVMPGDVHETDTNASLKEILNALNTGGDALTNDLFDAVERLLDKHYVFVSEGIREKIAHHNDVSWYLSAGEGMALISYQDGRHGEWQHGCYADEVPLWLLIFLFRRIAQRKRLGDQETDETIKRVDQLDIDYANERLEQERKKNRERLTVIEHSSMFDRDPGGEP